MKTYSASVLFLIASAILSYILGLWGAFLENQLTCDLMTTFRLGNWMFSAIIMLLAIIYSFRTSLFSWIIFFF
jgi:hypothetical protein